MNGVVNMHGSAATRTESLAVLVSGGLDSAILLGDAVRHWRRVQPLYIRHGLFWEETELRYLQRFLAAIASPALEPLHVLELPVADVYGEHWSITGRQVPDATSADEAVFLPGRNVLLLAKAILWCQLHDYSSVALAPLLSNPFPDATASFFQNFQDTVNQAVAGEVQVLVPFAGLPKLEVMRLGQNLPLALTFSCIAPNDDLHCGACNKCAERRRAFDEAKMQDPTSYA